jgi:hypothetical protein
MVTGGPDSLSSMDTLEWDKNGGFAVEAGWGQIPFGTNIGGD